eukprot:jgi/Galph1/5437/GphlegSOOS_G4090.1
MSEQGCAVHLNEAILSLKRVIGRGSLGAVFKGSFKVEPNNEPQQVAAKFIHLPNCSELILLAETIRTAMDQFVQNDIFLPYQIFVDDSLNGIWMISEYCEPGNVLAFSCRVGGLSELQIATIVKDIVTCLSQLEHRQGFFGLNAIKASNILLDRKGQIRLTDYQLCHHIAPYMEDEGSRVSSVYWSAPEEVESHVPMGNCASAGDIWALGVLVIELDNGKTPFYQYGPRKVISLLQAGERPQVKNPSTHSIHFLDFIHQCLQRNPQLRPTAKELLSHPFLSLANRENLMAMIQKYLLENSFDDVSDDIYLTEEWIRILSGHVLFPLPYFSCCQIPIEKYADYKKTYNCGLKAKEKK